MCVGADWEEWNGGVREHGHCIIFYHNFIPSRETQTQIQQQTAMTVLRFAAEDLHQSACLHEAKELKLQSVFMIHGDLGDVCFILPFAYLGNMQIQKTPPEFA